MYETKPTLQTNQEPSSHAFHNRTKFKILLKLHGYSGSYIQYATAQLSFRNTTFRVQIFSALWLMRTLAFISEL